MILRSLSLLLVLGLLGCGSRKKTSGPEGAIITPGGRLPGKVVSVNPTARFVVVRFPIGQMPGLDQRMSAYREGLKVADLKISGPQRDIHTVADVLAGECRAGDEVRTD